MNILTNTLHNRISTYICLSRVVLDPLCLLQHCRHCSFHSKVQVKQKEKFDMTKFPLENIRNFGIIAHIDHGKSTLSDRLLEFTDTISKDEKHEQVLDKLPVERERGITVKAQTASLIYEYGGKTYLLNLIDTPGHVDFSYEVSRALAACEGVILLVDANQGVQAQTIANFNLAFCSDKIIIPVLNKIDLKTADPVRVADQMATVFGVDHKDILKVSAKKGIGIESLLEAVIQRIPPPSGNPENPFRALLFDSWFDQYRGVITLIKVVDGKVCLGDEIMSHITNQCYDIRSMGIMYPDETPVTQLCTGQTGYLVANIKSSTEAKLGDTFYHKNEQIEPLPHFSPAKPMVFSGIFPVDQSQNLSLRNALEKLTLNDASVSISVDINPALGQGWRLGFLGLLHMEVFCQRLEQEFDAQVTVTAPSVPYKVKITGKKNVKQFGREEIIITNPLEFPDPSIVEEYFEPMVLATIITSDLYLGKILSLCLERRGVQKNSQNIDSRNVMLQFKFPLSEVIVDFYNELKSISSGYASFDYEDIGYESSNLVKMEFLLNGKPFEEMTTIVHAQKAREIARARCLKLKEVLPTQQFVISIQATVGGKIIARENIKAYRKDVTAKCHGGDISRQKKLLKRQADGKKKMRLVGNVEVPRDTFIKVLSK